MHDFSVNFIFKLLHFHFNFLCSSTETSKTKKQNTNKQTDKQTRNGSFNNNSKVKHRQALVKMV